MRGNMGVVASTMLAVLIALASAGLGQGVTGDGGAATVQAVEGQPAVPELTVEGAEQLVDIDLRLLSCTVYGKGAPTVILMSDIDAPRDSWNAVVSAVAEVTTVLTYDRAGYGDSTIGELPLHGEQSGIDLQFLLGKLGVPGPFIVVGDAYGASVARLFASRFAPDIGGIVLIDAQYEDALDEQRKVLTGEDLRTLEDKVARMKASASADSESGCLDVTNEQLRRSAPLPKVPFVVITARNRSDAIPSISGAEGREKLAALDLRLQDRLAGLVPGGKHVLAEGAGHDVLVEQPQVIVAAILDVVEAVRQNPR